MGMLLILAASAAAFAQVAPANAQNQSLQPAPLPETGRVEGVLAAGGLVSVDGATFACFAVDTPPDSRWTVRATSAVFAPEVWVARGALCNVANPAHRQVAGASGTAEVSFNSPGGRYLVLVRTRDAGGAFQLAVEPQATSFSQARPGGATQRAPAGDEARIATMRRQSADLEARREAEAEAARYRAEQQRLAQAQAEADRRAAERRRREESDAFWGAVLTGTVEVMNEVAADMAVENARMMAAQQREMERQQDLARQRQEQERQAREWEARNSGGGGGSSSPTTGGGSGGGQDRAAAEAHAQRLSQQQEDRRRQEREQIRQAEERRIAEAQRQAEARSQAWLAQQARGSDYSDSGTSGGSSATTSGRTRTMAPSPSGGSSRTGLQPVPRGTEGPSHHGSLSKQVSAIGQCAASSVNLNYDAHTLFGEPLASANWEFSGDEGCTAPSSSTVWLRIEDGPAYAYIRISTTAPTANRGEGTSMGSTGMDWSQAACGFNGARRTSCLSADDAKSLWVNGQVTGFEIGW